MPPTPCIPTGSHASGSEAYVAYFRLPMSAAIQFRSRSEPLPGYYHFEACILHPQAAELAISGY